MAIKLGKPTKTPVVGATAAARKKRMADQKKKTMTKKKSTPTKQTKKKVPKRKRIPGGRAGFATSYID